MFIHTTGNIFLSEAEAIVNPINCVGVMGKGLALEFKRRYPDMFFSYRSACQDRTVSLGKMWTYQTKDKLIVCFPTKNHWKDRSNLNGIEQGLFNLRDFLSDNKISSIAIPPIGCGLGGLNWKNVKPLIESILSTCQCKIYLYGPVAKE
jgi:O-acetyl-ADP-ribose deacetylase (regulator of RNase III)